MVSASFLIYFLPFPHFVQHWNASAGCSICGKRSKRRISAYWPLPPAASSVSLARSILIVATVSSSPHAFSRTQGFRRGGQYEHDVLDCRRRLRVCSERSRSLRQPRSNFFLPLFFHLLASPLLLLRHHGWARLNFKQGLSTFSSGFSFCFFRVFATSYAWLLVLTPCAAWLLFSPIRATEHSRLLASLLHRSGSVLHH